MTKNTDTYMTVLKLKSTCANNENICLTIKVKIKP